MIESDFKFLDSQVNRAVFMLQRTLGLVPHCSSEESYPKAAIHKDADGFRTSDIY